VIQTVSAHSLLSAEEDCPKTDNSIESCEIHVSTRPWTQLICGEANNMAALLSFCTNEEQKVVVGFLLWAEGVKGVEMYTHLCAQYGDNALP
jgi:hypothetical protein